MVNEPLIAIGASVIAIIAWGLVLVRSLLERDQRKLSLMMPVTALMASLGTLASALGFAQYAGVIDISISPQVLALVSSMGRGALAAAGIIVLTEQEMYRQLIGGDRG